MGFGVYMNMVPLLCVDMPAIRTALATLMRGDHDKGWLSAFALKCASWTAVNSGTSGRSPCSSVGNTGHESVRDANCLGSRKLVCILVCGS